MVGLPRLDLGAHGLRSRDRLARRLAIVLGAMLWCGWATLWCNRATGHEPDSASTACEQKLFFMDTWREYEQVALADSLLLGGKELSHLAAPSETNGAADATRFELRERPQALLLLPRDRLHVVLPQEKQDPTETKLRLTTASLDANEQRSVVGGRLLLTMPLAEEQRLDTEIRLLWMCEFLQSEEAGVTAFFAPGDSNIFATQGLSYGNNWLMLGNRWQWELSENLQAFAGYDSQFNQEQMFHIGSTGLTYTW